MVSIITAVDCGALSNPDNGTVDTSSGTTFMNTATYTCTAGYSLVGVSSRTCAADGDWTTAAPTCLGELAFFLSVKVTFYCQSIAIVSHTIAVL